MSLHMCKSPLWPATESAVSKSLLYIDNLIIYHTFNLCCLFEGKLHPELMTAAAWHSRALMHTFQPQSVANMIWAYATLAHQPPEPFLQVLCHHTMHDLPNFSPQNISNTVWALATLKYPTEVS